ncbi:hypothetical protein KR044_013239, partial [Drosophila immigrans]
IEVSRINFITDKSIKAPTSESPSASHQYNESPGQAKASLGASGVVGGAQIIWWAEQRETAASVGVSISCDACSSSEGSSRRSSCKSNSIKKLCTRRQHNNHRHHHRPLDKLRYCVRSKSLALFLEIVTDSGDYVKDHAHDQQSTPTDASLPLPASTNVNGCNFEYKTKIYALYRHVQISGTSGQVQQQQQLKVAATQLRFLKMLFAAAAAGAGAAASATSNKKTVRTPTPTSTSSSSTSPLLQDHHQLTSQPGERISSGE